MSLTPALAVAITSASISLVAAILAALALWRTHFARFTPLTTVGRLALRIFPIRSEAERWYLASFCIPVSVTNEGARPGVVRGLRLVLHFPKLPIPGNRESFGPKWSLRPGEFLRDEAKNRFSWIREAVVSDWMPFIVLPKATVTNEFLFETRWEEPVIQDEIICTLEILGNERRRWVTIGTWRLSLGARTWSELAQVGTCTMFAPNDEVGGMREILPRDLHKYTGTKEALPWL